MAPPWRVARLPESVLLARVAVASTMFSRARAPPETAELSIKAESVMFRNEVAASMAPPSVLAWLPWKRQFVIVTWAGWGLAAMAPPDPVLLLFRKAQLVAVKLLYGLTATAPPEPLSV